MTDGIDARPPGSEFVPSAGQVGIWIQDRMGAADAYNVSFAYRLGGSLDAAALVSAVTALIARHEVFRTVFREVDGEVVGLVLADPPPVDFLNERTTGDDVDARLEVSWRAPFDLTSDRLVRGCLLDVAGDHHVLSFTVHHVVFDDWSMGVLLDEFAELYRSHRNGTALLATTDDDAMTAHRQWAAARASAPSHRVHLDSAVGALADAPERLDLPRRRSESDAPPAWSGASVEGVLDADIGARVRAVARKSGCTEYVLYLAAWATLVGIYAQHDDVVVGTPVADRLGPGTADLVGYFLNTLVVRHPVPSASTFAELLDGARDAFYSAVENTDVPYEDVVRALSGRREDPAAPLFSVWFALDDATSDLVLDDVAVERVPVPTVAAKFELALFVSLGVEQHRLAVEYSSALYDPVAVKGLLRHYRRLLDIVTADPEIRVRDIDLLDDERAALRRWGRRPGPEQGPAHLAAEFAATALREADNAAVEHGEVRVSYAELKAMADGTAARLRASGIRPGDVVGISVSRSPAMIASVLGVLTAGAGYVALDPAYPTARLSHMIADGDIRSVLVDDAAAGPIAALGVATIPATGENGAADGPVSVNPKDLAYVTYTSGSTGTPKGIRMSHGAVWNLLDWQRRHYTSIGRGHRTLQFAALSFDVSAQEIFGALCTGGVLVLIDQHERDAVHGIMRLVHERRVDRVFMAAPALLEAVESAVALDVVPDRLRVLVSGSEQLVVTGALRVFLSGLGADARLFNEYGPSETHVATMYEAPADPAQWPTWIPIGTPVGDTEVRLLDGNGRLAPLGSVGEIHLAGPGLADGYSRLPGTTAKAFVPDPYSSRPGARMYRTGDLARFLPGGDIEFLGRRDTQVKIRGFRIELEEIRSVLDAAEPVAQSFVVVTARADQSVITAFWLRAPSAAADTDPWAHLRDHLPSYAVPTRLVEVAEFPLTAHGKVDQRALVAAHPDDPGGQRAAPPEPSGDLRTVAVAAAMARVLGRESVGEHDDFFEVGGHSLLANRLVWRLESEGIASVPLRGVFDGRTPARIAALARPVASRQAVRPAHSDPVADRLKSLIDNVGDGSDGR